MSFQYACMFATSTLMRARLILIIYIFLAPFSFSCLLMLITLFSASIQTSIPTNNLIALQGTRVLYSVCVYSVKSSL